MITTLVVYIGFKFFLPLVFPFVIAYFLAWVVRPVTEFFNRRLKIPRIIGGSISLILLIAALGCGLLLLIDKLITQVITFIKNVPIYLDIMADKLDSICQRWDGLFGLSDGTIRAVVDENILQTINNVKNNILPGLTQHSISIAVKITGVIGILVITFIAAMLIVKDFPTMKKCLEKTKFYEDMHRITEKLANTGIAYLRAQLIIMVVVAFLCVFGLSLIKNEYALLLGLGIAIMDAFPVLGSGLILIPWSIIMLFDGNIYAAAILITTYLICQVVREVLEPKLIGKCTGTRPLFMLIAMYVGIQLFSFIGFILGPIGLVIIVTTVRVTKEKLEEEYACTKEDLPYSDD